MKENKSKAIVGIIFSNSLNSSQESLFLAQYLGALLVNTGYASVCLVGCNINARVSESESLSKISYIDPVNNKRLEVPASDIKVSAWDSIQECHLIIVTVNSSDTETCATKLSDTMLNKTKIVILNLERGVKNSSNFKDTFHNPNGCIVIEGVVGFSIVPHSKKFTNVLACTTKFPSVVFERLTKDICETAEGPMNLMEETNIQILYRKNLTDTLSHTLSQWRWRVIYATMIRESCRALEGAARGGGWKPDLELVTSLSPRQVELLLSLPNPLFRILSAIVGFSLQNVKSPIQIDLSNNKITCIQYHFEELISTGKRYSIKMPICELILAHIRALECTGTGGAITGHNTSAQILATKIIKFRAIFRKKEHKINRLYEDI
eukprot:gene9504-19743_t